MNQLKDQKQINASGNKTRRSYMKVQFDTWRQLTHFHSKNNLLLQSTMELS